MAKNLSIAILGAGTMGRQLASVFLAEGTAVSLFDRNPRQLDEAGHWISTQANGAGSELRTEASLEAAVSGADLVLEAIHESLEDKRLLFSEVSHLTSDAILASNSSALPAALWAETTVNPGRLINAHFYVRPWERRVVEVMSCGLTTEATMELARQIFESQRFRVFLLKQISIGLLYNRIWAAIKREALAIVDEGIATPSDIDEIYRALDPSPSRGPFERMDTVGLDTVLAIEKFYAELRSSDHSPSLQRLVDEGHLGVKTGRGFFTHVSSDASDRAASESLSHEQRKTP